MHPQFGPFARRRGPGAFIVQMLRAPLTLNNIIALIITTSVQRNRQAALDISSKTNNPCTFLRSDGGFGVLALLFAASVVHNLLTVMRFHKIRRQVFGQSVCQARKQWRQRCRGVGGVELSDEEMLDMHRKFDEMRKRMPSLFISMTDIALAGGFLGLYVLMTMTAVKQEKVELGVAYSSIGALIAFLFNMIIGVNGLKWWVRNRREKHETEADEFEPVDVKTNLLG